MTVISRKFAAELNQKEMRHAYLDAQTRAKLAQQIRALRLQRGWSQRDLGTAVGKPQGNIARLEDRDVARYTLTTLLELASAFDSGLVAKFVTYDSFLRDTENLAPDALEVRPFDPNALLQLCEDAAVPRGRNFLNAASLISGGALVPHSTTPEYRNALTVTPGGMGVTDLFESVGRIAHTYVTGVAAISNARTNTRQASVDLNPRTITGPASAGWNTRTDDRAIWNDLLRGVPASPTFQVRPPSLQGGEIERLRLALEESEREKATLRAECNAARTERDKLRTQLQRRDATPILSPFVAAVAHTGTV